jgi:hypothetical protein
MTKALGTCTNSPTCPKARLHSYPNLSFREIKDFEFWWFGLSISSVKEALVNCNVCPMLFPRFYLRWGHYQKRGAGLDYCLVLGPTPGLYPTRNPICVAFAPFAWKIVFMYYMRIHTLTIIVLDDLWTFNFVTSRIWADISVDIVTVNQIWTFPPFKT